MERKGWIRTLEFSHFAVISLVIALTGGHGGIAVMKILENQAALWQLIASVGLSIATLVACISQNSTRWVVNLFILSTVLNIVLILLNF